MTAEYRGIFGILPSLRALVRRGDGSPRARQPPYDRVVDISRLTIIYRACSDLLRGLQWIKNHKELCVRRGWERLARPGEHSAGGWGVRSSL